MPSVVTISFGKVRGVALGRATAYLGIPYGASTAGDGRFRAPRPVQPWAGVRDATVFGPAAPQAEVSAAGRAAMEHAPALSRGLMSLLYPFSGSPVGGTYTDEDCLVLNVWTPTTDVAAGLPVMVWLHGGAFMHGAGSEPTFWADRLAERGDVVVVTVNHRLGALGFLPVDDMDAPDAGRAGMLDIGAALRWVRENITAFGGDAGNVTVFGQSGGGMKIAALMAMPQASGLFHKAIVQSGAGLHLPDQEEAVPLADALFGALGIPNGDLEGLRALPAAAIVGAQYAVMAQSPRFGVGFMPVRDGEVIVADPLSEPRTSAPDVPLLIGCTSEEAGMFLAMDPRYETMGDADLAERVLAEFGPAADAVLEAYQSAFPGADARGLLRRIQTDRDIRVANRQFVALKRAHSTAPVYGYLFDYPTGVLDGAIGAAHSVELPFVFDNADRVPLSGTLPGRDEVAEAMRSAWAAFAHTGSPRTPRLDWPAMEDAGETMVFAWPQTRVEADPDGERLERMAAFESRLFPRASSPGRG